MQGKLEVSQKYMSQKMDGEFKVMYQKNISVAFTNFVGNFKNLYYCYNIVKLGLVFSYKNRTFEIYFRKMCFLLWPKRSLILHFLASWNFT